MAVPIKKHLDEVLENQVIRLEEVFLVNCVLKKCHIFYGGKSFQFLGCDFQDCTWTFLDEAMNTVELLKAMGMIHKPEAEKKIFHSSRTKQN